MFSFLRISIASTVLVLAPSAALAQADRGGALDSRHHMASLHDSHAMDHAQALYHHAQAHVSPGTPLDRDIAAEHVRVQGEDLAAAQRHLDAEEHAMTEEQRASQRAHFEQIRAAHAEALTHQQALQTEVGHPVPDPRVVSDHAAAEYHAMRRAHEAHEAMGHDVGVQNVVVVPAAAAPPPHAPPSSRAHH